jgi:oxygen-independent coproporphyrinogen-3 oxidase
VNARNSWGIYVHVPWCRRRCPYCAFYVEVDRGIPADAFADAVIAEHSAQSPAFTALGPPQTVFFGGGTPSRMPGSALARMIAAFAPASAAEITAETNPEDADDAWLAAARAAGITRISLGIQTFDAGFARMLNRACSVGEARATLARVAAAGFESWSVDLIFGLPGQTLAQLDADLDAILASGAPHVSLYGLTIEPGTPFERAAERGQLVPADPDLWRDMYDRVVERLAAAGIDRYEVSNFARAGHRSRHNRLYWTDAPYLGLGPSAHGYAPDGHRTKNAADVARYLDGDPSPAEELPDAMAAAADLVVSALRCVEGLDRAHLARRHGVHLDDRIVRGLIRGGVLREDGERIALTDAGFPVADGVTGRVVDALRRDAASSPVD